MHFPAAVPNFADAHSLIFKEFSFLHKPVYKGINFLKVALTSQGKSHKIATKSTKIKPGIYPFFCVL